MTENTNQKPEEQPFALQINAQYIKDLSFEAPGVPQSFFSLKQPPEIKISVDVNVSKSADQDHYTVDLSLKVQADMAPENKTLFLCELVYGSLVTLKAPESHIEPLLLIEIPHLIFPYARAIISNLVREAGFPSLQINPIDFAALYRARLAQKHQEETKKGG